MTVTEFFLKQTTKEIRDKFKEVKLEKYGDFPDNLKSVCKMFDLEDDKLCDHYFTIKRRSAAEVYLYFNLPNPADPKHPMYFQVEYYVKSAKGACKVSFSLEDHVDIFKKVSTIFDNRSEYNNIEFRVWKSSLPEIFDEKANEWNSKEKYYCLKDGLTPWDYYQAICKYAEGVKPLLDMFVEATENGMFERIWNNLKPHDKWERGHEIFHAMFFPVIMNDYYKAVTAGVKPSLEEFVMLLAVSDELGKKLIPDNDVLQEAFDKMSKFNSPKETILEEYNYAINHFREKHLFNDDLKKWNETYVNANRELLKEVDKLKQTISNKYNINTEWLRCVCLHRNEAEVKWDNDYIPENAYTTK